MSEGRRLKAVNAPHKQTWKVVTRGGEPLTAHERMGAHDVVDMEIACVQCLAPLYVPVAHINAVLASLAHTGAAILICVCGQAQLIRTPRLPRQD